MRQRRADHALLVGHARLHEGDGASPPCLFQLNLVPREAAAVWAHHRRALRLAVGRPVQTLMRLLSRKRVLVRRASLRTQRAVEQGPQTRRVTTESVRARAVLLIGDHERVDALSHHERDTLLVFPFGDRESGRVGDDAERARPTSSVTSGDRPREAKRCRATRGGRRARPWEGAHDRRRAGGDHRGSAGGVGVVRHRVRRPGLPFGDEQGRRRRSLHGRRARGGRRRVHNEPARRDGRRRSAAKARCVASRLGRVAGARRRPAPPQVAQPRDDGGDIVEGLRRHGKPLRVETEKAHEAFGRRILRAAGLVSALVACAEDVLAGEARLILVVYRQSKELVVRDEQAGPMSLALQSGARSGFSVHFEADATGIVEGTAVIVDDEADHSRHELRDGNGDDLNLGGREGTLPQTAVQHTPHAGRVVHGLALVVNATQRAASHFDAVNGDDVHAGVTGQRPGSHVVGGRGRAPNHAEKGGARRAHDDFAPRGDGAQLWRPREDRRDSNV